MKTCGRGGHKGRYLLTWNSKIGLCTWLSSKNVLSIVQFIVYTWRTSCSPLMAFQSVANGSIRYRKKNWKRSSRRLETWKPDGVTFLTWSSSTMTRSGHTTNCWPKSTRWSVNRNGLKRSRRVCGRLRVDRKRSWLLCKRNEWKIIFSTLKS